MPRTYKVSFENVTCAVAQDLLQIKGASNKTLRLKRVWAECYTASPTSQNLGVRIRYMPNTVTDGSGGSAPTPQKTDPGDAAASFTALANSTTKATTSGTASIFEEGTFHVLAGYDVSFETPLIVVPLSSAVFELLSTPSGTVALSGGAEVEETG